MRARHRNLRAGLEPATGARANAISLADARRIIEKGVRSIAELERAGFIEIRSGHARIDVVISCRRRAKHLARCSWRASVFADYNGTADELELAIVCSGGARYASSASPFAHVSRAEPASTDGARSVTGLTLAVSRA